MIAVLNLLAMGAGEIGVAAPIVTITLLGSYAGSVSLTGTSITSLSFLGTSVTALALSGSD